MTRIPQSIRMRAAARRNRPVRDWDQRRVSSFRRHPLFVKYRSCLCHKIELDAFLKSQLDRKFLYDRTATARLNLIPKE